MKSASFSAIERENKLLGIVSRVSKETRIEPPLDAVTAFHHNSVYPGLKKLFVE
jgi:hypothetical protein